ncbi:MAG TPA: stimulus-sensing domain-containing protein [Alphaproteobacteria bacterium]|nr:stimulus-sensing domain-containing protein [Alphaproteobacteria bacterium]
MRRRRFSLLTRRILLLNLMAPVVLVAGLLYLDDYRRSLIASEFADLTTQSEIFAAALGAAAIQSTDEAQADTAAAPSNAGPPEEQLSQRLAQDILSRLVEPTRARARLFSVDGKLLADSRVMGTASLAVETAPLPPPGPPPDPMTQVLNAAYDFIMNWLPADEDLPLEPDKPNPSLSDYPEAAAALRGDVSRALRALPPGRRRADSVLRPRLSLTVAVPVQRLKKVLGVLMLSTDSTDIETGLRSVRFNILKVFGAALGVTVLISIYVGRTIARPIRRLALAAERVRRGGQIVASGIRAAGGGRPVIPDLSHRNDEIGDLSVALADMTDALWRRLDAIERFAADVSHEIKNPLTSLKSAVETATRLQDPERQRKLLAIVLDDVSRLDRLIGDISDASRLDAELSREETQYVDIGALLGTLVELHSAGAGADSPRLVLERIGSRPLIVPGLEHRLGQVFRNLITNAMSFSPAGGTIRLVVARQGDVVEVIVEDEGPGISEDKLEAIFERFYSDRPQGEKFGTHSGLGLSISRQIVTVHNGTIHAENRHGAKGEVIGARFVVRLPVD